MQLFEACAPFFEPALLLDPSQNLSAKLNQPRLTLERLQSFVELCGSSLQVSGTLELACRAEIFVDSFVCLCLLDRVQQFGRNPVTAVQPGGEPNEIESR